MVSGTEQQAFRAELAGDISIVCCVSDDHSPFWWNFALLEQCSPGFCLSFGKVVLKAVGGFEKLCDAVVAGHSAKCLLFCTGKQELSYMDFADLLQQRWSQGEHTRQVKSILETGAELLTDFAKVVTREVKSGTLIIVPHREIENLPVASRTESLSAVFEEQFVDDA